MIIPTSTRAFLKKVYRLLPINLQRRIQFISGCLRGDFRIVQGSQESIEIELSDDLQTTHLRSNYNFRTLERVQSPALSLFGEIDFFTRAGIPYPKRFEIRYRGVELNWFVNSGVWPPSLDSYMLAAALVDTWSQSDSCFWEVGCGTGIIGLHLLKLTSCREALLTDIDPGAIEHTRINAKQLSLSNVILKVERFPPTKRPNKTVDLLVSIPPYFPPGFLDENEFQVKTTDHLSLNNAILDTGLLYAKRVVFGFSSVILEEIMSRLQKLGSSGVEWKILRKERLPLAVGVINDIGRANPGVFTQGRSEKFDLWHDFYVCEFKQAESLTQNH
jgi:hypothetical protein